VRIYVGYDSKYLMNIAKCGDKFCIIQKKVSNGDLSIFERPSLGYITGNSLTKLELIRDGYQHGTLDTLLIGEINTYLEDKDHIHFQNVFSQVTHGLSHQEWRWKQQEGFDYIIINPDTREIAGNDLGLPFYLPEVKAQDWKEKGYICAKTSRYLTNGKPAIMSYL